MDSEILEKIKQYIDLKIHAVEERQNQLHATANQIEDAASLVWEDINYIRMKNEL